MIRLIMSSEPCSIIKLLITSLKGSPSVVHTGNSFPDSLRCLLLTMLTCSHWPGQDVSCESVDTKQLSERVVMRGQRLVPFIGNCWRPGPQAMRKKEWQMGPFVLGHERNFISNKCFRYANLRNKTGYFVIIIQRDVIWKMGELVKSRESRPKI